MIVASVAEEPARVTFTDSVKRNKQLLQELQIQVKKLKEIASELESHEPPRRMVTQLTSLKTLEVDEDLFATIFEKHSIDNKRKKLTFLSKRFCSLG